MALDPNPLRPRRAPLLRWHRWIGLAAALIVVVVAVTGVLINHVASLNLREIYVDNALVLDRYGLVPEQSPISYQSPAGWITWLDGRLFLNATLVADQAGQGVGAVSVDGMIAAAAADQIFLLTSEGGLVERLSSHALPGRIVAIGESEAGGVLINTDKGRFTSGPDLLEWSSTITDTAWSETAPLPDGIYQEILQAFRGDGVSLDRVLLDVHTGRLFGAWAPYVFDTAAVALLFLAISGVVNSLRTPRRRNRGQNGGV